MAVVEVVLAAVVVGEVVVVEVELAGYLAKKVAAIFKEILTHPTKNSYALIIGCSPSTKNCCIHRHGTKLCSTNPNWASESCLRFAFPSIEKAS